VKGEEREAEESEGGLEEKGIHEVEYIMQKREKVDL
jgi:hypothetical protein